MDSNYRPQSPDLSSYAPRSPDLSGLHSQNQDIPSYNSPAYGSFTQQTARLPGSYASHPHNSQFGFAPTSVPQQSYNSQFSQPGAMPSRSINFEDDGEYLPDASPAPAKRSRKGKQEASNSANFQANSLVNSSGASFAKLEHTDPTLGCQLKTSFPVARIKRIMQADEDIGKVAQVTPTVVSRALELFMIKLISSSAHQARGPVQAGGGAAKGPKRVLAQHLKKAVLADDTFDFLHEIVNKVPDAPTKSKKENGSDSEDGAKPRRKGKKRKDSMED